MKTARYEVLEEARLLRKRMDALRERPVTAESFPVIPGYDAEAHIAWNRDREEPWDRVLRLEREAAEKRRSAEQGDT